MKEPLMASGKTSALQLLTREAADNEKHHLVTELQHMKDAAKVKDESLRDKEQEGIIHHAQLVSSIVLIVWGFSKGSASRTKS